MWDSFARDDQRPPKGEWLIWLLMGGRGSGKTRAGAEWIHQKVFDGAKHIALIAPALDCALVTIRALSLQQRQSQARL